MNRAITVAASAKAPLTRLAAISQCIKITTHIPTTYAVLRHRAGLRRSFSSPLAEYEGPAEPTESISGGHTAAQGTESTMSTFPDNGDVLKTKGSSSLTTSSWPSWETVGVSPHLIGKLQTFLKLFKASPVQSESFEGIRKSLPDLFVVPSAKDNVGRNQISAYAAKHDVVLHAPTGSGKTLAYLLPLLHDLNGSTLQSNRTFVVIVAPTRELAHQITQVVEKLARVGSKKANLTTASPLRVLKLVGEVSQQTLTALKVTAPHILIGTPASLVKVCGQFLQLNGLRALVLDEADELVRNHHVGNTKRLVSQVTSMKHRPALLCVSATASQGLAKFVSEHARSGSRLVKLDLTGGKLKCPSTISHFVLSVPTLASSYSYFTKFLAAVKPIAVLAFCNSAATMEALEVYLKSKHIPVSVIGNAYSNAERAKSIEAISTGKSMVLISTEMAARGLDIPRLSHVVNFDLPASAREYVHRAGRVGRLSPEGVTKAGAVISWIVKGRVDHEAADGTRTTDEQHFANIARVCELPVHEVVLDAGSYNIEPADLK